MFAIQNAINHTFHFEGAQKPTPKVDLVITDIPEWLLVLGLSTSPSSILLGIPNLIKFC